MAKAITMSCAHDELMPDMPPFRKLERKHERLICEFLLIVSCFLSPDRIPLIEMAKLHAKERTLQLVHPVVIAELFVPVLANLRMVAQTTNPRRNSFIIRRNGAALAIGA